MQDDRIRKPAVCGSFYPAGVTSLRKQIDALADKKAAKNDIIACILPHAGYMYSGAVAVKTLSEVNIKDRIILLGPNHTGMGEPFSIMASGAWETPFGKINIDSFLAAKILSKSQYLKNNDLAHRYEHSLEVELPILQYFKAGFQIVPIVIASDKISVLKSLGQNIADSIKEAGVLDSTLIIASSDMTHYESGENARFKDNAAIESILELDEEGLNSKVRQLNISMCGYAPVSVALTASKLLGAKSAKVIKYANSGDTTGDYSSVVGYAGITIY